MSLNYHDLETLRHSHPTWRLLSSPHAPLIASFLSHAFVEGNVRVIGEADLVEALEDELFNLRDMLGAGTYPKSAVEYLNDWAAPEKGWLRKFYRQDSDEVQFDLTPATEKAIAWLESLNQRSFVGTESRLLYMFELLRQLSEGSTASPEVRLQELHKRREEIDREIEQVMQGNVSMLDDTALKDRFMQFTQQARELLSDFREVEHNFRQLDRSVRERIAQWSGKKGELLADIMGERDAISDSDQGNSFQAFWSFLMSPQRQEEFSQRLDEVLSLPVIDELQPDKRTRRIHYDWLEAGEHTQRTVAQLSQQLRRFLDDQAWLENRRIMDILHGIESGALNLRDTLHAPGAPADFMTIEQASSNIELPMERPLFKPPIKPSIANIRLEAGDESMDSAALYSQVVVDKAAIGLHIRQSLQDKSQVSLQELCEARPLQQGLAELVAYLELGDNPSHNRFTAVVDESTETVISWQSEAEAGTQLTRRAHLPRIIYVREGERH
jgi:flagellar motility protein MotE (MotC chaperone)